MATERTSIAGENRSAGATHSAIPAISTTRLYFIIAGLWLSLFMSAMDTTIITTALIKISSNFDALRQATWLVTAYLLTYNSFLMITAKTTDVFGIRSVIIACNVFFLIFSMACGGAQSMTQLIVFRALQGIGGSGMYSLVFVAIMRLITPEKMAFYSGIISSVFALANLLGPILGGVIVDNISWRWIFFINGPIVASAIALLFAMPGLNDGKSNKDRLRSFDIGGGILSVCWPIPLLFALQEGGVHYEWSSGVIVGTLTAGLVALLMFGSYEAWITHKTNKEPIFPFRFLHFPPMALLLLSMFLIGMPFYMAIIQLPQRFQAVNQKSAERSGVLLLPLTLLTPVGAMIAGVTMGKKIAAEYLLIISTAVVCVGIGLLSSLPADMSFWVGTYGYEVITGLGLGLGSPAYYFLLYSSVEEKDIAIGTGVLNMWRTLGGCVAIAICSALHHSSLSSKLPAFLTAEQISLVQDSNEYVAQLPVDVQKELGLVFGHSYNRQFQAILAFAAFNFLVTIALAIVRKRMGIFGMTPQRKEENEFTGEDGMPKAEEDITSKVKAKEKIEDRSERAEEMSATPVASADYKEGMLKV